MNPADPYSVLGFPWILQTEYVRDETGQRLISVQDRFQKKVYLAVRTSKKGTSERWLAAPLPHNMIGQPLLYTPALRNVWLKPESETILRFWLHEAQGGLAVEERNCNPRFLRARRIPLLGLPCP